MKIGELAERTGVSVRSLRYYETRQLITSDRTSGGQRVYRADAIERVLLVQQLFRAGLGSADVVKLLPCIYSGTTTVEMVLLIEREHARLDAQIRDLIETRDRLEEVRIAAAERLAA
ncbi:DNA-binding transcriptional regulator, MerR family [Rathayibacter oskolensis]|uniref:DNA-binding transcriptional regulator, MerR family n=1 Tax=Rathayibacter oskolensis TaxID=1891671 RepID=A0A1X7PJK2_9MICO|nr:MerR family transcriptional regulator [Rathayibacter oskolensis]SMH51093.1 DNA-binding transcriptional regulator, MerR family [Rathayibacter oskolensis]